MRANASKGTPILRSASQRDARFCLRNREHELGPWRIPGAVDEFEEALKAGEPVIVDSATLWIAFERAGIPNADFARHELGGRLDSRFWHVSEAGEVTAWTDADSDEHGQATE